MEPHTLHPARLSPLIPVLTNPQMQFVCIIFAGNHLDQKRGRSAHLDTKLNPVWIHFSNYE